MFDVNSDIIKNIVDARCGNVDFSTKVEQANRLVVAL